MSCQYGRVLSVTILHNVRRPQIMNSNDAPPSLNVRFFKISHDKLFMYSNMLITITILSIMRNTTIFFSIQTQQHRMYYDYSNHFQRATYQMN